MIMLSVILPFYNNKKTLRRTIESLVRSAKLVDFRKIEIVLIDNNSSDGSYDVVCDFSKRYHFITLCRESLQGVSHARNAGIKIGKGEYLSFVDSDDEVLPDYFSLLLGSAERNYDLIIYPLYSFDSGLRSGCCDPIAVVRNIQGWWVCQFLVRRKLMISNLFYGEYCEDFMCFFYIVAMGNSVCYVNHKIYQYNLNSASVTNGPAEERLSKFLRTLSVCEEKRPLLKKCFMDILEQKVSLFKCNLRASCGKFPVVTTFDFYNFLHASRTDLFVFPRVMRRYVVVLWRQLRDRKSV